MSSSESLSFSSETKSRVDTDLHRLARFGANLCDAHSCFIFLPLEAVSIINGYPVPTTIESRKTLALVGGHSLSSEVVPDCKLPPAHGLIGWVARHKRSIHVSPFELDSRTLGVYTSAQELKSFIAAPIELTPSLTGGLTDGGVIACDSKKSFAFSRPHGKLLEDLAKEIGNVVDLLSQRTVSGSPEAMWTSYLERSEELKTALGDGSLEIVRIVLANAGVLEAALGTSDFVTLTEQLYRLTQQALPPHVPLVRLPQGDMVMSIDSLMCSFYEARLTALCERVGAEGLRPQLEYRRSSGRDKRFRTSSIEELVAKTARVETVVNLGEDLHYGNG